MLVAVYTCSEELVSGEIINNNDVPIIIDLAPRWLDSQRQSFHEVEFEPLTVPATSTAEWEAEAGEDIERPQFCEAETISITSG